MHVLGYECSLSTVAVSFSAHVNGTDVTGGVFIIENDCLKVMDCRNHKAILDTIPQHALLENLLETWELC